MPAVLYSITCNPPPTSPNTNNSLQQHGSLLILYTIKHCNGLGQILQVSGRQLLQKQKQKQKQKWFYAHRQKHKVTTEPGLNISCAFANCATAIQLFPAITKMSAIMVSQPRPVTNYNRL